MVRRSEREGVDVVFEALADRDRRVVVRYLRDVSDGTASYEDLAETLFARGSGDRDSGDVRTRLHHVILPKLREADLVEFDPRSETVRYRSDPVAETVLDEVEGWVPGETIG